MDPTRFDRLAMAVGQSSTRRTTLGLLAALGLTGVFSEEASAAVCLVTGERCGDGRGTCCSGICKGRKKRCRCPVRRCCQCDRGEPVPCAYVESSDACVKRCRKRAGTTDVSSFLGTPGEETYLCEGTQCRRVDCVPV